MGARGPAFPSMEEFEVRGRKVLLRLDINSPLDPETKRIVDTNRIDKSLPTVAWLLDRGACLAIIAHQGDTLDYQNLISLEEHARILSEKLGREVAYVDDVCGPAAVSRVKNLKSGEAVLLGNLRYLCEEISTFEDAVKLTPPKMVHTWLVRSLAPLFDLYINDAFAAAHRNCPSMVAFQELLPSGAGPLFFNEVSALTKVMADPDSPAVFLLGGAKISDAFGMLGKVLSGETADLILTAGLTGQVFRIAQGGNLGKRTEQFLTERSLDTFIEQAAGYLERYPGKILMPVDFAFLRDDKRTEILLEELPEETLFMDIGEETIEIYREKILQAGTVFVNGPAGVFEDPLFEKGTRELWKTLSEAEGYTVVGGGDSVSAVSRFTDADKISYICTAGGAMVRFLSGRKLPLIEAMEKAAER